MEVMEEEDAAPLKSGRSSLTKIAQVSVKQSGLAGLQDQGKQQTHHHPAAAQETQKHQSSVDAKEKQLITPTVSPQTHSGSNAPLQQNQVGGLSMMNLKRFSPSAGVLVPVADSSLPLPAMLKSVEEAQKLPGEDCNGCLKEVSDTHGQDQHLELTISSPGSDTENSHQNISDPGLNLLTLVKGFSANGDNNAATGDASLRQVLSDPGTGTFMDDAMVARCGHTYGSASLIAVLETGKCVYCDASVPAESLVPNLAIRAAVHAFKQEDHVCEFTLMKAGKRRREEPEEEQPLEEGSDQKREARMATLLQDPVIAGEQASSLDGPRPKGGAQFPFAVSDRVVIKGNKRTPERFVGKEAIITTQCLNGWYLVQTVDHGESVRLQYRSLQKVEEMDAQPDSEARKSLDQVGFGGEKPTKSSDPKERFPSLPMTEELPEGSTREIPVATTAVVFPIMPVKGVRTELHKKARRGDLARSIETAAVVASSTPSVGTSSTSSPDIKSEVKTANLSKVRKETEVPELEVEDDPYDMTPVWVAPPLSEKVEPPFMDKTNGGSSGDKLLEHTQVWEGPEEPQDLQHPDHIAVQLTESTEVGSMPIVLPSIEVADAFTVRSKRSVLANRAPSVSLGMESDSCHKVDSSDSRRCRSVGEDLVVHEQLAANPVGSKPLAKCTAQLDENAGLSEWVGPAGEKHIRQVVSSISNMEEILPIMKKDILELEKKIPWNCLVKSWKLHRANWRKGIKQSSTVLALGTKVKTFRTALLLTEAGGLSDEEWEKRIGMAMESGDVELLVSLWGRLYDDVFKWVESKSKHIHETAVDTSAVETFAELRQQFPQLQVAGLSPAAITTAATLAAADAIAEHRTDTNVSEDCDQQALLAVPMKLLQQHSREDLFAVRDALEREKRHLAAKIARLEENETLNKEKEDLVAGFLVTGPPSSTLDIISAPLLTVESVLAPTSYNFVEEEQRAQGSEMDDEGVSDAVDSNPDTNGEATDRSDSD